MITLGQFILFTFITIGFTVCTTFAIAPCVLSGRISQQECRRND
ncbi:hypothetical protein [Rhizobium freirei]|nr:hypothetical protein [Rhizobium freirei]